MKSYSPTKGKKAKNEADFLKKARHLDLIVTAPDANHAGVFDKIHGNDISNLYVVRANQGEIVLKAEGNNGENLYMKLLAARPRWFYFWRKPWVRVELVAETDATKNDELADWLAEALESSNNV